MKIISTLALLSLLPVLSPGGGGTGIRPENQAILTGAWTPTAELTAKALLAIQTFLENPKDQSDWSKKQIGKILENGSRYRVQFIGVEENGRRILRCNFFPESSPDGREMFPQWKERMIFVLDGGFWFWRVDYDIETGECSNFESNGNA